MEFSAIIAEGSYVMNFVVFQADFNIYYGVTGCNVRWCHCY